MPNAHTHATLPTCSEAACVGLSLVVQEVLDLLEDHGENVVEARWATALADLGGSAAVTAAAETSSSWPPSVFCQSSFMSEQVVRLQWAAGRP